MNYSRQLGQIDPREPQKAMAQMAQHISLIQQESARAISKLEARIKELEEVTP